jgi:thiamine pyrophosphokinase
MRAFIFANGQMKCLPKKIEPFKSEDLIIAADGGLRFCIQENIVPHLIVGDLDSVDTKQLAEMQRLGSKVIQYPVNKDATDLELSIKSALSEGAKEIILLSALGARWDMTFSNVLMMTSDFLDNAHVRILDDNQEMFCIKGYGQVELIHRKGTNLSLLPLSLSVEGITLQGMKYSLNNECLNMGSSRGLSNVIVDQYASIRIQNGVLLVFCEDKSNEIYRL